MKIIPKQESVMATVKRDTDVTDLLKWHRRLGHLRDTMLKKLVNSKTIKGMDVTHTHLNGIGEECILSKWMRNLLKLEKIETLNSLAHYMPIS